MDIRFPWRTPEDPWVLPLWVACGADGNIIATRRFQVCLAVDSSVARRGQRWARQDPTLTCSAARPAGQKAGRKTAVAAR